MYLLPPTIAVGIWVWLEKAPAEAARSSRRCCCVPNLKDEAIAPLSILSIHSHALQPEEEVSITSSRYRLRALYPL